MPIFNRLRKFIYRHFKEMRWQGLFLSLLGYSVIGWILLKLAGETALTGSDYPYWLLVTASTVGYGDLSPETIAGKLLVAFYVIPLGLGLFALTVGKVAAFGAHQWRKGIMGLKNLNLDNHILVIGWDPERTPALLRLLQLEAEHNLGRTLCLCVTDEIENPMPGEIEFVRVSAFNDDQDMDRASVSNASSIIIDTSLDDSTLAAGLYCHSRNEEAHIIAFFRDQGLSKLLKSHCPNVECTPSVSVELMVKAAMDPGSSILHQELLNASQGMTQFSVKYPDAMPEVTVRDLYVPLKETYGATLIAVDLDADGKPEVNPSLEQRIRSGCMIYYIAPQRIKDFNWSGLASH